MWPSSMLQAGSGVIHVDTQTESQHHEEGRPNVSMLAAVGETNAGQGSGLVTTTNVSGCEQAEEEAMDASSTERAAPSIANPQQSDLKHWLL